MKDLCKAMGIEVEVDVKCSLAGKRPGCPYMFSEDVTCCGSLGTRKCEHAKDVAMPGPDPTDEAFCWRVLQWLRSDWKRWDSFTFYAKEKWDPDEYSPKGIRRDFTEWLLDPARFIGLCDGWCRDHEEARS